MHSSYRQQKLSEQLARLDRSVDPSFHDGFLRDDGCEAVCEQLADNATVTSIDLCGNDIRSNGARALGRMLLTNRTLRSLRLEWNLLGLGDGMAHLCDALAANSVLSYLDLRNNKLGPGAGVLLGRALVRNGSLTHVDVRWNNLQRLGGQALVDALAHNTTIQQLQVSGNQIPLETMRALNEALDRNREREMKAEFKDSARLMYEDQLLNRDRTHAQTEEELQRQLTLQTETAHASIQELQQMLSVNASKLEEAVDRYNAEAQAHSIYRERVENQVQELREQKSDLSNKFLDAKTELEKERALRQQAVEERDHAEETLEQSERERQRVEQLRAGETAAHLEKMSHLHDEVKRLQSELDRLGEDGDGRLKEVQARLTHETSMRASESALHEQTLMEKQKLHEMTVSAMRDEHELEATRLRQRIRELEALCSRQQHEVTEAQQSLLELKIAHEEGLTKFEQKIRDAQETAVQAKLASMASTIHELEAARDRQIAGQTTATAQLQRQREEAERWLQDERNAHEKLQREHQEMLSRNMQLESELKHQQHHVQALESTIEEQKRQQDVLIRDHRDALDKVLQTNLVKLQGLEDMLRKRDEQIIHLTSRYRSLKVRLTQMEQSDRQRTNSIQTALVGLQDALGGGSGSSAATTPSAASSPAARGSSGQY